MPEATPEEHATAAALRRHVATIAKAPRNLSHFEWLQRAVAYIDGELTRTGHRLYHSDSRVDWMIVPPF